MSRGCAGIHFEIRSGFRAGDVCRRGSGRPPSLRSSLPHRSACGRLPFTWSRATMGFRPLPVRRVHPLPAERIHARTLNCDPSNTHPLWRGLCGRVLLLGGSWEGVSNRVGLWSAFCGGVLLLGFRLPGWAGGQRSRLRPSDLPRFALHPVTRSARDSRSLAAAGQGPRARTCMLCPHR